MYIAVTTWNTHYQAAKLSPWKILESLISTLHHHLIHNYKPGMIALPGAWGTYEVNLAGVLWAGYVYAHATTDAHLGH